MDVANDIATCEYCGSSILSKNMMQHRKTKKCVKAQESKQSGILPEIKKDTNKKEPEIKSSSSEKDGHVEDLEDDDYLEGEEDEDILEEVGNAIVQLNTSIETIRNEFHQRFDELLELLSQSETLETVKE